MPKNVIKQKIIYGAGYKGREAFDAFGSDNIFCFADKYKAGGELFGKKIVSLSELTALQDDYEITICLYDYKSVVADFTESGIIEYTIWREVDDIKIINHLQISDNNMLNLDFIDKNSELDFIEYPEQVLDYIAIYNREAESLKKFRANTDYFCLKEGFSYGGFEVFRNYADSSVKWYEAPIVSHGIKIHMMQYDMEIPSVIISGTQYKDMMQRDFSDILHFTVGPQINYAVPFYNEVKSIEFKKKLGRCLLVFPMHTMPQISIDYREDEFVDYVMQEGKRFDSIMICSYFNDYGSNMIRAFRLQGCTVVTAGLVHDKSFFRRLKTIISAADAVVTNGRGSHIVYCLSLNKPIKAYRSEISIKESYVGPEYNKFWTDSYKGLEPFFYPGEFRITKEQIEAYDIYAGFTKLRSKQEIAAIFEIGRRIMQGADYRYSKYIDSMRTTYRKLQNSDDTSEQLHFELMKEALPQNYEDYLKALGI